MGSRVDNQSKLEVFFSPGQWQLFNSESDSLVMLVIKVAEAFALAILIITVLYPVGVALYWAGKKCCYETPTETDTSSTTDPEMQLTTGSTPEMQLTTGSTTSTGSLQKTETFTKNDSLRNNRSWKQIDPENNTESRTSSEQQTSAPESTTLTQQIPPQWQVPENVKNVLKALFQGSQYSFDDLPMHTQPLGESDEPTDNFECPHVLPKLEQMSQPVMKFVTTAGRPMLAIRLDTRIVRDDTRIECVFVLRSGRPRTLLLSKLSEYHWEQANRDENHPLFFSSGFLLRDGTLNTRMSQADFNNVQQLLRAGYATDNRGVTWHIHGHPNNIPTLPLPHDSLATNPKDMSDEQILGLIKERMATTASITTLTGNSRILYKDKLDECKTTPELKKCVLGLFGLTNPDEWTLLIDNKTDSENKMYILKKTEGEQSKHTEFQWIF